MTKTYGFMNSTVELGAMQGDLKFVRGNFIIFTLPDEEKGTYHVAKISDKDLRNMFGTFLGNFAEIDDNKELMAFVDETIEACMTS